MASIIALFVSSPALAQKLGGGETPDISIVRVIAALMFCVLMALGGAWALRFRMTGRFDLPALPKLPQVVPRKLVLIERLRLGPQHELCIIAHEDREFIISVSPAGIARFDAFAGTSGTSAP